MDNIPNTVLLIDDDYATNFLHKRFFEKADFDCSIVLASNGEEGIEALLTLTETIADDGVVVIILDINMPVMDGWSFLKEFKDLKTRLNYKTTLFMVSSSINPDDRARAESNSMVRKYISKPITKDSLEMIKKEYC
jgi:CheY-like chemotaxis protein